MTTTTPPTSDRDPKGRSCLMVAISCLLAIASSGLAVYPFHTHPWAPWTWAALSMALGPVFVITLAALARKAGL